MSETASDWTPMVLAVAPNGARKTQADHAALPITPDEIARAAAACREAGAAMIHLHVRDREGRHSLDAEAYRAAIAAIRREVGDAMVIQVTSESVGLYGPAEQMAMVRELRPEAVSLAVRELVPDGAAEAEAADFLAWLRGERILPQFIVYSEADLKCFVDLVARGVVPGSRHFLLYVLGRYTKGQVSEPADLLSFLAGGGLHHTWGLCAFGRRETACAVVAAALGGHPRVGFENNLHLANGVVAPDNAALVAAVAGGAAVIGRPLADADEARAVMAGWLPDAGS